MLVQKIFEPLDCAGHPPPPSMLLPWKSAISRNIYGVDPCYSALPLGWTPNSACTS